jgi:hypothetical protein
MQEITTLLPNIIHDHQMSWQMLWNLPIDLTLIAQTIQDSDLLGNVQKSFSNFIESGQAWALLIGLIIGYMIRGLTI